MYEYTQMVPGFPRDVHWSVGSDLRTGRFPVSMRLNFGS